MVGCSCQQSNEAAVSDRRKMFVGVGQRDVSPPGHVCPSSVLVGDPSFGKSTWRRDVDTVNHRRRGRFAAAVIYCSLPVHPLLLFPFSLRFCDNCFIPALYFPLDNTCYNIVNNCWLYTVDIYLTIWYISLTVVPFNSTQSWQAHRCTGLNCRSSVRLEFQAQSSDNSRLAVDLVSTNIWQFLCLQTTFTDVGL